MIGLTLNDSSRGGAHPTHTVNQRSKPGSQIVCFSGVVVGELVDHVCDNLR